MFGGGSLIVGDGHDQGGMGVSKILEYVGQPPGTHVHSPQNRLLVSSLLLSDE